MKTVALYMRLSSEDAYEGESYSIGNQRDLLYDYIRERREFDGCPVLEFCDDGYSGTNFQQPNVQKMLSLAGKTVDCILVKDFSRFGRNLIEVGDYLDQIFPFLGVRFIAVNENYDSKQNMGRSVSLDVSLKSMISEMYSRDISDKIRCVQQAKMRKGGEYFCAIAFYGYRKSGTVKNKLEVDEPAAEIVRRIFRMACDGRIPSEIAVVLNREGIPSPLMYRKQNHMDQMRGWNIAGDVAYWTRKNVRRIIMDERYTGCLVSRKRTKVDVSSRRTTVVPKENWIVSPHAQDAIVSKEMLERAQLVWKPKPQKHPPRKPYQKFYGLVKCACCNRALTRNVQKHSYFSCPTARTVPDSACTGIRLSEQQLEETVLRAIQTQVQTHIHKENFCCEDAGSCLQEEIQKCQAEINRYKALQTRLFEEYADAHMEKQDYVSQKQKIVSKQKELENHFAELSRQFAQSPEPSKTAPIDFKQYAFLKELDREVLVQFIKEIRVSEKNTIEIQWNFNDSHSKEHGNHQ